jgi:hypothetical protein
MISWFHNLLSNSTCTATTRSLNDWLKLDRFLRVAISVGAVHLTHSLKPNSVDPCSLKPPRTAWFPVSTLAPFKWVNLCRYVSVADAAHNHYVVGGTTVPGTPLAAGRCTT